MALTIDDKIKVRQIANEEVQYSLGETNQRLTAVEDRLGTVEEKVGGLATEVGEIKATQVKHGRMLEAIMRHLGIDVEE